MRDFLKKLNSFQIQDGRPITSFFYETNKKAYALMFKKILGKKTKFSLNSVKTEKDILIQIFVGMNDYDCFLKNLKDICFVKLNKEEFSEIEKLREDLYLAILQKEGNKRKITNSLIKYVCYKYILQEYIAKCKEEEYLKFIDQFPISLSPHYYFRNDSYFVPLLLKAKFSPFQQINRKIGLVNTFFIKSQEVFKKNKNVYDFFTKTIILSEEEDYLIVLIFALYFIKEDKK